MLLRFTIVKLTFVNDLAEGAIMKRIILNIGLLLFLTQTTFAENQVVGTLPYSNQWEYEKADSYLFLVYDPQSFSSTNIRHGDYNISLLSSKTAFYGINYFTKLSSLLPPEKKELAIYLKFSLEFSTPSTGISSDTTALSSASNTGQLFLGRVGAGPTLSWDLSPFLKPFVGAEFWGYAYRHTASINSADFTGSGLMVEPMVGLEAKIIDPVHAMAQLGFNHSLVSSESTLLGNSTAVSLGLGAMF